MGNGIVRHILLARYKDNTSDETLQSFFNAFREMTRKIEGVVGFEYGANNSSEGMNRGLTHVMMVNFDSVQARDAYLPHPEHQKFVAWLTQADILEELLVVDYISQS